MGVVYLARHVELGRQVAIKLLLNAGDLDASSLRRFRTEAEAVGRLRHPGIVAAHDLAVHQGQPYLVMDFVEGESLAERLKRGPMPPRDAARLTVELAEALAHAHENSVLHRDLKPANVLLDGAGRPYLTDFGLAKDLSETRERLTRTGQVLGTPGYMPPEQANGSVGEIDQRSDVYSLGAILYALLTGRAPFKGATVLNTIHQVLTKQPEPPSSKDGGVPKALDVICLRALAKARGDRHPSALALAQDLERFLAGEAVEAKRSPWLAGVLVAALAALGVAGAVVALPSGSESEPESEAESGSESGSLPQEEREASESESLPQEEREASESESPTQGERGASEPPLPPLDEVTPRLLEHPGLRVLAFLDDQRLVTASSPATPGAREEQFVRLWDRSKARPLRQMQTWTDNTELAVEPNGARILLGGNRGLTLLDIAAWEVVEPTRELPASWLQGLSVDWKRGRVFLGRRHHPGADRSPPLRVQTFDLDGLSQRDGEEYGAGVLRDSVLSPDGRHLALGLLDPHEVELYEVDAPQRPRASFHKVRYAPRVLAYAPDGALLVGDSKEGVYVLPRGEEQLTELKKSRELEPPHAVLRGRPGVLDFAFRRRGEGWVVYALIQFSMDRAAQPPLLRAPFLRAWTLSDQQEVAVAAKLRDDRTLATDLDVSPDGRVLAVGTPKGAYLWRLPEDGH